MLLMDVKAKWRQAKIHFEAGSKTLKSLISKVDSYINEKGVSAGAVAGAAVGAAGK